MLTSSLEIRRSGLRTLTKQPVMRYRLAICIGWQAANGDQTNTEPEHYGKAHIRNGITGTF
jgi:hypothetical protein